MGDASWFWIGVVGLLACTADLIWGPLSVFPPPVAVVALACNAFTMGKHGERAWGADA